MPGWTVRRVCPMGAACLIRPKTLPVRRAPLQGAAAIAVVRQNPAGNRAVNLRESRVETGVRPGKAAAEAIKAAVPVAARAAIKGKVAAAIISALGRARRAKS